ncbi:MAG: ACP phosphodiesterase [Planctomycetota bacterium]
MNFLAHLVLADDTPASRLGNLLPDLHRGRLPDGLHPEVAAGVRRHRRVDAYTDRHPAFERSRRRLRPDQGRYAGVIADVLYDHTLCLRWSDYVAMPRRTFIDSCYAAMRGRLDLVPPRAGAIVRAAAAEDWLGHYDTVDGIRHTLRRLSARLRERFGREVDLAAAADVLQRDLDGFLADFDVFFPDLIAHLGLGDAFSVPAPAPGNGAPGSAAAAIGRSTDPDA